MIALKDWFLKKRSSILKVDPLKHASIQRTISEALNAAGLSPERGVPRWTGLDKPAPLPALRSVQRPSEPGRFFWSSTGEGVDKLEYKLYLPSCCKNNAQPAPLIVMLHGCSQDPDDFSLGTRMNAIAEKEGVIVAYPQQTQQSNPQKCWNWFLPKDQVRNSGEPKRIAAMIDVLFATYPIDRRRVFVSGMSAGAAMALIMGRTYPDIFEGVGVHSGLPYRCANNVVSALSVMRDGRSAQAAPSTTPFQTPLIVFHSKGDKTVHPKNGEAIVRQALRDWPTRNLLSRESAAPGDSDCRDSEKTIYRDAAGQAMIEWWVLHSGGHLWSGGDAQGSHTDAAGPDASAEMMRFFLRR
jgi:poly(hydroxyalkanoate) depolymerase family esterase